MSKILIRDDDAYSYDSDSDSEISIKKDRLLD
jgi:hypothetical protein